MDIGAELREARLQAGLSREELSQRTKIQLAKLEALENNAFERLPEGIYLDGLIRAYAAEVGLDGLAMVARLHRHNAPPLEDEIDRANHDRADYIVPPPATTPAYQPPEVTYAAAPPDLLVTEGPPVRRSVGRFALPLLMLLGAIALGAYLYDRNRPFVALEDATTAAVSHDTSMAGDAAAANGTPARTRGDAIPADRPASSEHHVSESLEEPPVAPTPSGRARARSTPNTSAREEPRASSALLPGSGPRRTESSAGETPTAVSDLSGSWTLDTRVESSSLARFEGLQLGYRLELQQSGDRVTGRGVKTFENGRELGAGAQTFIAVHGTVEGRRLTLSFTEQGSRRESGGKMILDAYEDGILRGRFSSSAARSMGTVEARRSQG